MFSIGSVKVSAADAGPSSVTMSVTVCVVVCGSPNRPSSETSTISIGNIESTP
jgi:hypothetical protein